MTLFVVAPHFAAGVTVGSASMTAPIVRYMSTWSAARIAAYCMKKGWSCTEVP